MTDEEFLGELAKRNALIVHCSRPGKGDEGIDGLLFPQDLQNAIDICANQSTELCCSVVWPGHTETFGAIGIILKPRSTASVTLICTTDGGTSINPQTGRRDGAGTKFSAQAVLDTFANPAGYNEWNVQDAETIGIFVHPSDPPEVAQRVPMNAIPGCPSDMEADEVVVPVRINASQIKQHFNGLPLYTLSNTGIMRLDADGWTLASAADIYR